MTLRPTLEQCFPSPLSRQWPSTGNPVSCECRQLYALVALCSCVPRTHLLVLTEGEISSQSMAVSMPRGPKYLPFQITAKTTAEDISTFLIRANGAGGRRATGTAAPEGGRLEDDGIVATTTSAAAAAAAAASPRAKTKDDRARAAVVVVCLTGIATATPAVRSVVMDVLSAGQVRGSSKVVKTPSLRIVAFSEHRSYMVDIPEALRSAFALSTCLSALSQDSATVLQLQDLHESAVINKRHMIEIMSSADGQPLLETVTLHSAVARYLRHLVLTVRGSTALCASTGVHLLRRLPHMLTLLRAAAVLFVPDEDVYARQQQRQQQRASRAPGGRGAQQESLAATLALMTARTGTGTGTSGELGGARTRSGLDTFADVVVSPADVACLLPALVTHHLTYRRDLVALAALTEAADQALNGQQQPQPQSQPQQQSTTVLTSDPRVWDARAVSWGSEQPSQGDSLFAASPLFGRLTSLDRTAEAEGGGGVYGQLPSLATLLDKEPMEYFLNYREVRELIRAAVLCRSAPAPG